MGLILHCTRRTDWEAALRLGRYEAPSLTKEGFIHFSTPDQVVEVANRLFRGQEGLVLLCADAGRLAAPLRFENLEGGRQLYPHVYGPVNVDAIVDVVAFPPQPVGTFVLPDPIDAHVRRRDSWFTSQASRPPSAGR